MLYRVGEVKGGKASGLGCIALELLKYGGDSITENTDGDIQMSRERYTDRGLKGRMYHSSI